MNKLALIKLVTAAKTILILISALVFYAPLISSAQEKKAAELTCPIGSTPYYQVSDTTLESLKKGVVDIALGIITFGGSTFITGEAPGLGGVEKTLARCLAPLRADGTCGKFGTYYDPVSGKPLGCITPPIKGEPKKITQPLERYNVKIDIPCQKIAGGACPEATTPAGFITRFYQFSLMIAGLAAFGSIVFGAIQYILAAGKFASLEDAKSRIYQAIMGLLLLLGAYLILYTINPKLVNLRNPDVAPIEIKNAEEPQTSLDFGSKPNIFSDTSELNPFCKTGTFSGVTISSNIAKVEEKGREAPTFSCITPKPNAHLDEKTGEAVCNEGYVGLMAPNNSRCISKDECYYVYGHTVTKGAICQQE